MSMSIYAPCRREEEGRASFPTFASSRTCKIRTKNHTNWDAFNFEAANMTLLLES